MPDQMVHPRPPQDATDLRRARNDYGLSLREMARQARVSRAVVREAETGRRPRPENAKRIADFFGVAVSQIWPEPANENGPAALATPGPETHSPQEAADVPER